MARRKSAAEEQDTILNEVLSAVLFTLGLFSLLSLVFYSAESGYDLENTMGSIGVYISGILGKTFGVSSVIIPILLFYTAYIVFVNKPGVKLYRKALSAILLLFSLTTILGLAFNNNVLFGYAPPGGWIGKILSTQLKEVFTGTVGSYLIVTIFMIISLIVMTDLSLNQIFNSIGNSIMYFINGVKNLFARTLSFLESNIILAYYEDTKKRGRKSRHGENPFKYINDEYENDFDNISLPEIIYNHQKPKGEFSRKVINLPVKKDFKLPPIDFLDPKTSDGIKVDKDAVYKKAQLIEEKLKDFGVTGKVTEIRPGPVITMFEYKPSPGIKINKIASLENDLAMGLSALSIRIIAPIPGKNVIGIEVPNEERETVSLRELLEDTEFVGNGSILTIALGKDISGKPYYMNLRRAPHLMIAGTTGSGKSVLLNAMLTSLLYKASPNELKFIMIDPKMLELSIYEDIPHLLHPVVTDSKKAAAALRWAVEEMELRYKLLSDEGVRDIETHNRHIEKLDEDEKWKRWLPYIVIVIDELADLMMVAPSEIKESITRLSQKARAAGIHLIVATQRPSVDIVAGLLKANFPARISFHVSSKIDSRIILDTGGAESLLGKGDMLYLKAGASTLKRIQGALISDEEREKITDYLRAQAKPVYNELITKTDDEENDADIDEEKDELYLTALKIIAENKQASISMLQRKLRIGYNRAARIVEIMEKEGVIGPQESAGKPRDVYIEPDQIKEIQH